MLQIKIHGQTPKGGKSICTTCKHARVVKGQNCEEYIKCGADLFSKTGHMVPFKVAECTEFHPVNMPWKYEMEDMAWIVEARKRGPTGFQKAPDDKEGEMEVIIRKPNDSNGEAASPTSKY